MSDREQIQPQPVEPVEQREEAHEETAQRDEVQREGAWEDEATDEVEMLDPEALVVRTTSWNQARALGLENIGKIAPGFYADIVVLDGDFKVKKTFVNGELRYSA